MMLPILFSSLAVYVMVAADSSNPNCPIGDTEVNGAIAPLQVVVGVKNWVACLDQCPNVAGCLAITFGDAKKGKANKDCAFYGLVTQADLIKSPSYQFANLSNCGDV